MSEEKKSDAALREEEVLAFWNTHNTFEKSVEKDAPEGEYVFYDGPPFATGTPHYGHLVGSAMKDMVPRYWTMRGYRVKRQWGWDCHGLPLENQVEKNLGISGRADIESVGIKKFNDACREEIAEVSDVWGKLIPRFGRWADMENPYRTMETSFMETEWWMFKTLFEKDLIYEAYRSIHICPRCETTLSQSEVTEGYQDIKDLSATVAFALTDDKNTAFLAWTTTPWTLPGNVALAVAPEVAYATVESEGKKYILAEELVEKIFNEREHTVVETRKGSEIVGLKYEPPFNSYTDVDIEHKENGWKVYAGDFVTTEDGTGIVHIAPAFGQDDLDLAKQHNLPFVQHVGMDGIVSDDVPELKGLSVKPIEDHQSTDIEVIKYLAGEDILFAKEKYEHSYPHCWRCDAPLINYATGSWFVAVEKMKDDLLKHAEDINWSPTHIKKGRWGNWLEGARDWSISRQRFWANTIPVWRCSECEQLDVFGSIEELAQASGTTVTDLHKDIVDEVVYPCSCGAEMRRVPDVLDTWFNSGSVPFASYHYPFENKDLVDSRVPADFIAEGADQTRAWFYYQHVLAVGALGKPAFKNVIVNGLVLAEDGKKMSKRLKNYPDPEGVINAYGADAVRLYMLSAPVVRTEDLHFSEKEVGEISRKVMGRLVNVYSFYELYKDVVAHEPESSSMHVLDQWIITRTHQLHADVTKAMDAYELDRATRPLIDFVDDLSTWYVRRSRDRFKSADQDDIKAALQTLRWVLRKYAKIAAPATPFITDWLWQRVRTNEDAESVHLAHWCTVKDVDTNALETMAHVREVVTAALEKRAQVKIKVRQPLASLTVNTEVAGEYLPVIMEEVNVKGVHTDTTQDELVTLDTNITPELQEEGDVRELARLIQGERKNTGLEPGQAATGTLSGPADTLSLAEKHATELQEQTQVTLTMGETTDEVSVTLNS